jgi:hypothetical protein
LEISNSMENSDSVKKNQKLIHSESMKELGDLRYLIGIVFLGFALYFAWNGIYLMAAIIIFSGFVVIENCSELIIDKEKMLLIKRVGLYKPIITVKSESIKGVESVIIQTYITLIRKSKRSERTIKTMYRILFNKGVEHIEIKKFADKSMANKFAKEISVLLNIKLNKDQ